MDLSREEAQHALATIAASQTRSSTLAGYRRMAPYLILWGLIWMLAYGVQAVEGPDIPWLWPLLSTAGGVASFALSRVISHESDAAWRARSVRVGGTLAALLIFAFAAFALFAASPRQGAAFFPLLVALAYSLLGIWFGARLLLAGVALGVLTLFGYFALGPWFYAWMAVIGGGALIGFGVWLERI